MTTNVLNKEEQQYLDLIKNILENGSFERGRNGYTKSIFGNMMRFSLHNNTIPILTTKKMAWKTCLKELLWFISGDTNNFLIGLCDISSVPKGDPRVTSCQISALEARPVWSTGVNIYGANSMSNLLVWGRKNRESNYGGQQNQNNQSNVTYKIESPDNIIVTIATPNGCSISEKFTKSGSDIFHQTISYSGRCQEGQARAIQEEIKSGKTKVEYLRVN